MTCQCREGYTLEGLFCEKKAVVPTAEQVANDRRCVDNAECSDLENAQCQGRVPVQSGIVWVRIFPIFIVHRLFMTINIPISCHHLSYGFRSESVFVSAV